MSLVFSLRDKGVRENVAFGERFGTESAIVKGAGKQALARTCDLEIRKAFRPTVLVGTPFFISCALSSVLRPVLSRLPAVDSSCIVRWA